MFTIKIRKQIPTNGISGSVPGPSLRTCEGIHGPFTSVRQSFDVASLRPTVFGETKDGGTEGFQVTAEEMEDGVTALAFIMNESGATVAKYEL